MVKSKPVCRIGPMLAESKQNSNSGLPHVGADRSTPCSIYPIHSIFLVIPVGCIYLPNGNLLQTERNSPATRPSMNSLGQNGGSTWFRQDVNKHQVTKQRPSLCSKTGCTVIPSLFYFLITKDWLYNPRMLFSVIAGPSIYVFILPLITWCLFISCPNHVLPPFWL